MKIAAGLCAVALAWAAALPAAHAGEPVPGSTLESLLELARERNPELAAMRHEADAAGERVVPAGALPDPKLRTEFLDITRRGDQSPTLAPGRVGSMRYTLMQELPWFGKRDLKREIAELEAEGARSKASGTWSELAARIKAGYAQLWYLQRSERLTREILDLLTRLEKLAQARYAGGLAAQQDVIRAQVEQTNLKSELVAVEAEGHHAMARLNSLLARPSHAPLAQPERLRQLPVPAKLDYAALEERVKSRNPQLFADEARIKAAEKSRELAAKARYPDFTVGVAPNQFGNSVKEWDLMVEINIPLRSSTYNAQEREAAAMASAARTRRDATANQLLADLSENLAGLEAARQTENLVATSLIPQAELTFQAALAGYETGKVDFATLLDAQRQIREARRNQLKAQAEGQVRLADIERLLGEDL